MSLRGGAKRHIGLGSQGIDAAGFNEEAAIRIDTIVHIAILVLKRHMVDGIDAFRVEGGRPFIDTGHEPILPIRHKHLAKMLNCLFSLGLCQRINENRVATGDKQIFR